MSKKIQIIHGTADDHETHIRQLFREYAQLLQTIAKEEFGMVVDHNDILNGFMSDLKAFYPPTGKILLAKYNHDFEGIGCLKPLTTEIGEIKRMFVRSNYRRIGLGKTILDNLMAEARSIGYTKLRLDSPKPFLAAHKLYESRGFRYITAYEGSEAATSIPDLAVYMELDL